MDEESAPETSSPVPTTRGAGKGSRFFALGRDSWDALWTIETGNRLNLVSTFLVLLAGTGSDHRLTKWSAKACEEHVGMGKPRAKRAIEELIVAGLVAHTEASAPMTPQYRMPELARVAEPIFLPVQLITGLAAESPILRRVRESGDPLLLRMLIDLYGLIQTDATHGVPIENLRQWTGAEAPSRKIFEMGVTAIWALGHGTSMDGSGDWVRVHYLPDAPSGEGWQQFWDRIGVLRSIGALWFEPWVFDGPALDAEPLIPVDVNVGYGTVTNDPVSKLTERALDAATLLAGERDWLIENNAADVILPLALHQQAPALRGVARLRVEADTPGRRRSYALRMSAIERYSAAYARLEEDALEGRYDRPISSIIARDAP